MQKPVCNHFSSGPCGKRSNWRAPSYKLIGRSHRSIDGVNFIKQVINLQREVLNIPTDYFLGIISASTTGAMETLLWSLLGVRGVDLLSYCIFSHHWANDVINELKISDARKIEADFPKISNVDKVAFDRDVVFCLSSTTSGVSFNDLNWIPDDRQGLTICDAASAAFAVDIDWTKLDATAFSWQKGIAGEAGFGTIVLSPKAILRLKYYKPAWPIPRIFRLANDCKINYDLFNGLTINTPSMICLEEFYNNLLWAKNLGGIDGLVKKINDNYEVITNWINSQNIFDFLVEEKYRAHHIACFDIKTLEYRSLSDDERWLFLKQIIEICQHENVGFDFLGHVLTRPHLRIWSGATIDANNLKLFLPWLSYAYSKLTKNS